MKEIIFDISEFNVNNKPIDSNAISSNNLNDKLYLTSTIVNFQSKTNIKDKQRLLLELKNERLKWISLSLVCITILCILLVGTLIWFFTCRQKQNYRQGFQPVVANSSNV